METGVIPDGIKINYLVIIQMTFSIFRNIENRLARFWDYDEINVKIGKSVKLNWLIVNNKFR